MCKYRLDCYDVIVSQKRVQINPTILEAELNISTGPLFARGNARCLVQNSQTGKVELFFETWETYSCGLKSPKNKQTTSNGDYCINVKKFYYNIGC